MTDHRPPPPEPEDCLTCSRASRYKGGTLVAEEVLDLAAHLRRIADPDGYRPVCCPRCGGLVLHVHDYPRRIPRGEPGLPPEITVVRHICAEPTCAATWRILPAFLARHLWRVWPTVERAACAAQPPPPAPPPPIPARTARRWRERLTSAAKLLVVLLATSGGALLEAIAKRAGLESTRLELVDVFAQVAGTPPRRRLADLAAIVHRLERGIRLM
jgi:hypothetical protein